MTMLTDHADLVIGVDTHKHTHTAAFVDRLGGVHGTLEVEANAAGYRRLLRAAGAALRAAGCGRSRAPAVTAPDSPRCCSRRLSRSWRSNDRRVPRVGRARSPIRSTRCAPHREVLAREHQIEPRQRGNREAIRVLLATRNGAVLARTKALNHLHALVVTAPEELRARLSRTLDGELARAVRSACGSAPT